MGRTFFAVAPIQTFTAFSENIYIFKLPDYLILKVNHASNIYNSNF